MIRPVEAPVAAQQQATTTGPRGPRAGDWAIAILMLVFFVLAYVLAQQWPFRAALFPQIVSVAGALVSLLKVAGLALQTVRGRRSPAGLAVVPSSTAAAVADRPADTTEEAVQVRTAAATGTGAGGRADTRVEIVDDEAEEDESMEYVFATAGGRAWIEALAWVVAFFVAFFVLGAIIAVPLFALLYLRFSGKASWLAAGIYASVTGTLIYVVFREIVYVPLPTGYIPFLQF